MLRLSDYSSVVMLAVITLLSPFQGSNEGRVFKDIYNGNCHAIEDSREFSLPASSMFSYYKAEACVVGRESQVCSISEGE